MIVLGIETSCDETSFALINGGHLASNIIASQSIHTSFGGVIPEYAAREHDRQMIPLLQMALQKARVSLEQLEGIAVTTGPGLIGALLVGLSFAKGLSLALNIPLKGINHLHAHMFVPTLEHPELTPPYLCLLISGGHTLLAEVRAYNQYQLLGTTLDDAAGEAFDKGAKLLNLGYPGGRLIEKLARHGDPNFVSFPIGLADRDTCNFSFSGLKTALLYFLQKQKHSWIKEQITHICASYQKAIIEALIQKTALAVQRLQISTLAVTGGVAANQELRRRFQQAFPELKIIFPSPELCGDNAAMIAYLGRQYLLDKQYDSLNITARANLNI